MRALRRRLGEFQEQCGLWLAEARAAAARELAALRGRVDACTQAAVDAARVSAEADSRRAALAREELSSLLRSATARLVPQAELSAAQKEGAERALEARGLAARAARQAEEIAALEARVLAAQEEASRLRVSMLVRCASPALSHSAQPAPRPSIWYAWICF